MGGQSTYSPSPTLPLSGLPLSPSSSSSLQWHNWKYSRPLLRPLHLHLETVTLRSEKNSALHPVPTGAVPPPPYFLSTWQGLSTSCSGGIFYYGQWPISTIPKCTRTGHYFCEDVTRCNVVPRWATVQRLPLLYNSWQLRRRSLRNGGTAAVATATKRPECAQGRNKWVTISAISPGLGFFHHHHHYHHDRHIFARTDTGHRKRRGLQLSLLLLCKSNGNNNSKTTIHFDAQGKTVETAAAGTHKISSQYGGLTIITPNWSLWPETRPKLDTIIGLLKRPLPCAVTQNWHTDWPTPCLGLIGVRSAKSDHRWQRVVEKIWKIGKTGRRMNQLKTTWIEWSGRTTSMTEGWQQKRPNKNTIWWTWLINYPLSRQDQISPPATGLFFFYRVFSDDGDGDDEGGSRRHQEEWSRKFKR